MLTFYTLPATLRLAACILWCFSTATTVSYSTLVRGCMELNVTLFAGYHITMKLKTYGA